MYEIIRMKGCESCSLSQSPAISTHSDPRSKHTDDEDRFPCAFCWLAEPLPGLLTIGKVHPTEIVLGLYFFKPGYVVRGKVKH